MKRLNAITLIAIAVLIGSITSTAWAEGKVDEGQRLAQRWCTSCHVIVKYDDETKFAVAPRFTALTSYTEERLRSRLMMRHALMPQFPHLTLQNVADISAYLQSLGKGK